MKVKKKKEGEGLRLYSGGVAIFFGEQGGGLRNIEGG